MSRIRTAATGLVVRDGHVLLVRGKSSGYRSTRSPGCG